jgi:hypothetical protein
MLTEMQLGLLTENLIKGVLQPLIQTRRIRRPVRLIQRVVTPGRTGPVARSQLNLDLSCYPEKVLMKFNLVLVDLVCSPIVIQRIELGISIVQLTKYYLCLRVVSPTNITSNPEI